MIETGAMQRRGPQPFISPLLQPPLHKLFVPRPFLDTYPPTDYYKDGYTGPRTTAVTPYIAPLMREPELEERDRKAQEALESGLKTWDPNGNPSATSDAFKTLFVGRLPYDVIERQLKREFEIYGAIKSLTLVQDKLTEKPKGYAFIEFEREEDMKSAYKDADAKKINGRRIVVDVERGRTVKDWRPRRLGGGLGKTRVGVPAQNQAYSGRDPRANDLLQKLVEAEGGRRERSPRRDSGKRRDDRDDRHTPAPRPGRPYDDRRGHHDDYSRHHRY